MILNKNKGKKTQQSTVNFFKWIIQLEWWPLINLVGLCNIGFTDPNNNSHRYHQIVSHSIQHPIRTEIMWNASANIFLLSADKCYRKFYKIKCKLILFWYNIKFVLLVFRELGRWFESEENWWDTYIELPHMSLWVIRFKCTWNDTCVWIMKTRWW